LAVALAIAVLAGAAPAPSGLGPGAITPTSAAGAPVRSLPHRPSLTSIEAEFMCPVCGVPLDQAFSPQADRERAFIRRLYAQGATEPQIKRALIDQYGSSVLATPPGHGFDLSAYLVPLGVVLALVAGLGVLLVRWRRRPDAPEAAGASPVPAPSPSESRRLEDDLARWPG
jgi:cytochrome c-type biogenesis protein CcmH/NrfF